MNQRRAPFYLRHPKDGPLSERRANGSWAAEPIFTKRIPRTVDFQIDGPELDLYPDVARFVKRESARAAAEAKTRASLKAVGPDAPRARRQSKTTQGVESAATTAARSIAPRRLRSSEPLAPSPGSRPSERASPWRQAA